MQFLSTINKNKIYKNLFLWPVLFSYFLISQRVSAEESKNVIPTLNINKNLKSEYILGIGDQISVSLNGINTLDKIQQTIDLNGEVSLPEIDKINVEGYTIKELEIHLENIFENYMYDPDIKVTLLFPRPLNIYVSGEVQVPGLYQLSPIKDEKLVPIRVFNAIQSSKGLNSYADLSKITIIRQNSKSQGGGKIKTNVNLLEMINEGDQSQNIKLFDGDSIVVTKI